MKIKLFTSQPRMHGVNIKQHQTIGNMDLNMKTISINLQQWQLLASGGAHWIFHMKQGELKNSNNLHHKLKNATINKQSSEDQNQCYENGQFILKLRHFKWLKQIINIKKKIIGNQFQSMIKKRQETKQEKLDVYNLKTQRTQQCDFIPQKLSQLKQNPLSKLIHVIYWAFIQEISKSNIQNQLDNESNKYVNQPLLPQIVKSIVKQSQRYYFYQQSTKANSKNNQEHIKLFTAFTLKQVLSSHLKKHIKQYNLSIKQYQPKIHELIQMNLQRFSIDTKQMFPFLQKQNFYVTFQSDVISQVFCQLQVGGNDQLYGPDTTKQQLKVNFQVFEFKPKTILPDIYTESFIEVYLNDLKRIENKFGNRTNKQASDFNYSQTPKDKQAMIRLVQISSEDLPIRSERSGEIQPFNLKQKFSQQGTNQNFNIQCTRWFKKNCLEVNKKKNDNPLAYFCKCLVGQEDCFECVQINFRDKKYLRNDKVINVYMNKQIRMDQFHKESSLNQYNTNCNQSKFSHKQIVSHSLLSKTTKPSRNQYPLTSQQSQTLQNQIINQITRYNKQQNKNQNQIKTKMFEQTKKLNLNVKFKQTKSLNQEQELKQEQNIKQERLSLVQQILALQLIDVVTCDSPKQSKQYDSQSEEKKKNQNGKFEHRPKCKFKFSSFVDIVQVQRIAKWLTKLADDKCSQIKGIVLVNQWNQQYSQSRFDLDPQLNSQNKQYPTGVISNLNSLFRQQVYQKSRQLHRILQKIIFSQAYITFTIMQTFKSNSLTFQLNQSQSNQVQIQSHNLKSHQPSTKTNKKQEFSINQIKYKLFFVMRYLISLTWKDVSVILQSLSNISSVKNAKQKQFAQSSNIPSKVKQNLDNYRKRQFIGCHIIDFNIKTIQNIYRNLQKEKQFLYYYQSYNHNDKLTEKQAQKL